MVFLQQGNYRSLDTQEKNPLTNEVIKIKTPQLTTFFLLTVFNKRKN